ncbi:hypothetical protein [Sneathiella limimaris]|uniref:hypothetical protein n=1 Tax=Sneathiella limimaris TaxID=1964213 RepID=UPI00146BC8E4|nr:hypothetical protein [Sneathiella limimaris]
MFGTIAHATTLLDFTSAAVRDAVQAPTSGQVAFAGTIATISATGGALTWTGQDGNTCASPPLACQLDGIGITDDEISGGTNETVTVSFGEARVVESIYFLDLFAATNQQTREQAQVSWGGGSSGIGSMLIDANWAETPNGASGYLMFALNNLNVAWLEFLAPTHNPGDELGVNDFSLAAISVSTVPLPAALPLYGSALAVLGFLGWRRKQKATT